MKKMHQGSECARTVSFTDIVPVPIRIDMTVDIRVNVAVVTVVQAEKTEDYQQPIQSEGSENDRKRKIDRGDRVLPEFEHGSVV